MNAYSTALGCFLVIEIFAQIVAFAGPPQVISASCFDGKNVGIQFDQALKHDSAVETSHYSVNAYGEEYAVSSARLNRDGQSVNLILDREIFDATFNLCLHDVQSTNGETMTALCPIITRVNNMKATRIGHSEVDLIQTESLKNTTTGTYEFDVRTGALGGTADDSLFVYERRGIGPVLTDGFLLVPEDAATNVIGGIMIRESLDPRSPFYAVLASNSPETSNSLVLTVRYRLNEGTSAVDVEHSDVFPKILSTNRVRVSMSRAGNEIKMIWTVNPGESWNNGPAVTFPSAFLGEVLVGSVAAVLSRTNDFAARVVVSESTLRGDFPPHPRIGLEFGRNLGTFSWPETSDWRYHLVQSTPSESFKTWYSVPIWPTVIEDTNAAVTLPLSATQSFFGLRLNRY